MSRILFDARSIVEKNGGVSRVAERVLAWMRATHPNEEIVTITTGFVDPQMTTDGVQNIHLKLPNKLWSLLCLFGLTSLDRIAAKMSGRNFDELILPNVGFVGVPKIPYTIVVHDLSFLIEPTWFPWKMRVWHSAVGASRLIKNASTILCVSETTARDVQTILSADAAKIKIIPREVMIGASGACPERPQRSGGSRRVLAFDGSPRKNVSTIEIALQYLRHDEQFRDVELIVIGRDRRPSDAELADLYRNASALLYPSWYEGFGLPLHEAAAYGIPILASNHGALPETAPPGTILINPAKPHLWASALKDVLLA